MDSCAAVPNQHLVARWLNEGGANTHVDTLREAYRERKVAMSEGLNRLFPGEVRATDPDGGFFLWVTFEDESINTEDLMTTALEEGVAYIPAPRSRRPDSPQCAAPVLRLEHPRPHRHGPRTPAQGRRSVPFRTLISSPRWPRRSRRHLGDRRLCPSPVAQ
jgi:hypothetical protein